MSKTENDKSSKEVNVNQIREDIRDFIVNGYYDGEFDCSADAAFAFFRRLRVQCTVEHHLLNTSDEQIVADYCTLKEGMEKLTDDFSANHDDVKKSIDTCLDRYIPGLRKHRERSLAPSEKESATDSK